MTAEPLARLVGVGKRFEDATDALQGVDLDVHDGEVLGLVGANGSGKTTLLRILAGLTRPTSGKLEILGRRAGPTRSDELRRDVAIATQDPALDPEMTANETLELFAALHSIPRNDRAARRHAATRDLGLDDILSRPVARLSGGQRQRLHLALALLQRARLLLLDEPSSALDPSVRASFWRTLKASVGPAHAVVVATHDLENADERFDRIAMLSSGEVLTVGEPRALRTRHASTLEEAYLSLAGEPLQKSDQSDGVRSGRAQPRRAGRQ